MKFKRQDYFRYKKLEDKWRRPRGRQSKMRKCKGGAGKMPRIGYGTKKEEKGKIKIDGKLLNPVLITNLSVLEKIGKNDVGIISSALGLKKVEKIKKIAKEKGIMILNKKRFKALMKRENEIKKKKQKEKQKTEKKKELKEQSKEAEGKTKQSSEKKDDSKGEKK